MNPTELAHRLRDDIAEALGRTDISVEDDLTGLGLDSIRLMVLLEKWRQTGVELSFLDALATPTAIGLAVAATKNATGSGPR
jgi:aryl carrier-like protein